VILACVSAIASVQEQSVLTAVQLLWINLIQDTFAALALATDPPSSTVLNRTPEPKNASVVNFNMWKMIIGQGLFQLAITLVLAFAGTRIFTGWTDSALNTVVFNTYVWMQIFNQINCRRIDNNFNVFTGMHRNPLFLTITSITIGGQILIIYVGGTAFSVTRLDSIQWAVSIILGMLSLPFGALLRLIPNYSKSWFSRRPKLNVETSVAPEQNPVVSEGEPAEMDTSSYAWRSRNLIRRMGKKLGKSFSTDNSPSTIQYTASSQLEQQL
jgi:Ca2+-transporting ATPase